MFAAREQRQLALGREQQAARGVRRKTYRSTDFAVGGEGDGHVLGEERLLAGVRVDDGEPLVRDHRGVVAVVRDMRAGPGSSGVSEAWISGGSQPFGAPLAGPVTGQRREADQARKMRRKQPESNGRAGETGGRGDGPEG